ncbi:REST corepressor [Diplonema papillatum]|nr:REST corepressor [Diplonema papillatum]
MPDDGEWKPEFLTLPRDHPAHAEVDDFFSELCWTDHSFAQRELVVRRISEAVKKRMPTVTTELFGSTRSRTYLPDGDVDLTLCRTDASDGPSDKNKELDILRTLVNEVLPPLAAGQPSELINAEVKLVKCVIDNLQVDITIDQYGGLTTFEFLEHVNEKMGCNGIFKRSLILVKAWACYEAHILGANGWLLGSYSLTVMLIAVFQKFDTLALPEATPLDVLMQFLDYYAAFDFTTQAVCVLGSVPLVAHRLPAPAMAAVAAAVCAAAVALGRWAHPPAVLSHDFFRSCRQRFTVDAARQRATSAGLPQQQQQQQQQQQRHQKPDSGPDPDGGGAAGEIIDITALEPRHFQIKAYNIMDPLRQHNNLGRSISRGNGHRVQASYRQASIELNYLCSRMARGIKRYAAPAEKMWVRKWLRYRRSEDAAGVVYGTRIPPNLEQPGLVQHFFKRTKLAVERRRTKESLMATGVPGIHIGFPEVEATAYQLPSFAYWPGPARFHSQPAMGVPTKMFPNFPFAPPPGANMMLPNIPNIHTSDVSASVDPQLPLVQGYPWWPPAPAPSGPSALGRPYDSSAFDQLLAQEMEGQHHPPIPQMHQLHQLHPHAHHHHPHMLQVPYHPAHHQPHPQLHMQPAHHHYRGAHRKKEAPYRTRQ